LKLPAINFNELKKYFSFSKPFLLFLLHLSVLFMVYKLMVFLSIIAPIPNLGLLKKWDAFWYLSITENGYQYNATDVSNSGFFPLFSYIWKIIWDITGSEVHPIIYFNLIIFYVGMLMLKKAFNFSLTYFLLFISVPSNMFMYVPYTEATFFFFSALMLAGLKKNNQWMILIGLFFASLTRPTAVFFIPAIICMEVFAFDNIKKSLKNILLYSSVSLLGIFLVVIFQFKQTGVWFAYFKAQTHFWKRALQWPDIPFTTWDGPRLLWLDGIAIFFGLLATAILVLFLIRKLRKAIPADMDQSIFKDKAIFFSLCYLVMAMFSIVFFNGKDEAGGTTLMGGNRYILATAFFAITLFTISHRIKLEKYFLLIFVVVCVLVFYLLRVEGGGFIKLTHNDKFYYRLLVILGAAMYLLTAKQLNNRFVAMVYIINVFTQVLLMYYFASGAWVG